MAKKEITVKSSTVDIRDFGAEFNGNIIEMNLDAKEQPFLDKFLKIASEHIRSVVGKELTEDEQFEISYSISLKISSKFEVSLKETPMIHLSPENGNFFAVPGELSWFARKAAKNIVKTWH
jgi:hypothetical protein